ncbi:TfuA-like protein [Marinivivus vitaminiproducens]|uniref:TfuA-like protein n=1 Tax=Marinivivus vitaminiproducens TaxID=3035935 RepID=UPI00279D210B|nr:TfuA-like protein [Geminicoccaceae bacterium SCSIO 64248]
MRAVVFLGPSLRRDEAETILRADYRGPAAQGDVFRATSLLRPGVIAIVDGTFRDMPAVWHKEILWALAQGVHVVGGASMGALRAAELHAFGMEGVGRVFEAYRDGVVEDDDEVAVLHGPAETGYLPLSDAMIDIRMALADAVAAGAIGPAAARRLTDLAKAQHYPERSYAALWREAAKAGLAEAELAPLRAWLAASAHGQKRSDALAVLERTAAILADRPRPFVPAFRFEPTSLWQDAIVAASLRRDALADDERERVLDELRLQPDRWREVRTAALAILAAGHGHDPLSPSRSAVDEARRTLRLDLGLTDRKRLDAWSEDASKDGGLLDRLAEQEARLDQLARQVAPFLPAAMLDVLHRRGDFSRLRRRALEKAAALRAHEGAAPCPGDPAAVALLLRHFEDDLAGDVPDDLSAYVRDLGLADEQALLALLFAEYAFREAAAGSQAR